MKSVNNRFSFSVLNSLILFDWYGSHKYECAFMASDLIFSLAAFRSLIIAFIGAKLPKSAAKNTMATIMNKKALTAMVNELNGSRFSGLNIFLNHSRFKNIHKITIAKYTIVKNHSYHFLLSICRPLFHKEQESYRKYNSYRQ